MSRLIPERKDPEEDRDITIENSYDGIVAAYAQKGAKQYQEDSWCIFCSDNQEVIVCAIFDGHGGINGRVASNKCRILCYEYFKKRWKECLEWSDDDWKKKMVQFFDYLHQSIRDAFVALEKKSRITNQASTDNVLDSKGVIRKSTGYPMHGGTTASVVITLDLPDRRKAICANVGDSDALLLPLDQKLLPDVQKNYVHLSVDHGPDNASEFARIAALPAKDFPHKLVFIYDKSNVFRKFECPKVFLPNGQKDPEFVRNPWGNDLRPTNVRYDPAVYAVSPPGVREDVTCIAMTRSLGDFYAHQFGLSWVPSVQIKTLSRSHDYLIAVGSDGIWDCWKFEDFSDFATQTVVTYSNDMFKSCRSVVNATVERAKALFGARSFDDASAAFAILRKTKKPKAAVRVLPCDCKNLRYP